MDSKTLSECKRRAAERAADMVQDGQIVGLGTGSTAKFMIESLGARVRDGLKIIGVATSVATEHMAGKFGIPVVALNDMAEIDITIDGADEVDPSFNMIKGGGGALTREKLVALASKERVIVVDETKLVETLGISFKLPVEVLPIAWAHTTRHLSNLGCEAQLRIESDKPLVTDNGNYILDCDFGAIASPEQLEKSIKLLPGVVECGLFIGIADLLIIGASDGIEERRSNRSKP